MNKNCFPKFINAVVCDRLENDCIFDRFSGNAQGRCREKTLSFKVIRNKGTEECEEWIFEYLEVCWIKHVFLNDSGGKLIPVHILGAGCVWVLLEQGLHISGGNSTTTGGWKQFWNNKQWPLCVIKPVSVVPFSEARKTWWWTVWMSCVLPVRKTDELLNLEKFPMISTISSYVLSKKLEY